MNTITIPKTEYRSLKRQASAFRKVAEEITRSAEDYPYDLKYITRLTHQARTDARAGRLVSARSVDEALRKSGQK